MDKKSFIRLMECILLLYDKVPDHDLLLEKGFSLQEINRGREILKEIEK